MKHNTKKIPSLDQLQGSIQTYSGRIVYPLNLTSSDVDIRDIAHSLSMKCRFSGHTKKFYCPAEDQRILTADLRWVPAGDIKTGDKLFGFDEYATELGAANKKRRKIRPTIVTHRQPIKRKIIRLELENGTTLRASAEHPWLIASKTSNNQKWETGEEISLAIKNGRKRWINSLVPTWSENLSKEAGWLSGIYDGEGYFSFLGRRGVQMGCAQRPGLILDEIEKLHKKFGFDFGMYGVGKKDVINIQLRGGWREYVRLLGTLRPVRLLEKFVSGFEDGLLTKQLGSQPRVPLEIVKSYTEPAEYVAGIETSTHTYICEGFGAHNSVAEHAVRVSYCLEHQIEASLKDQYKGLHHDDGEAYLVDLPSPLKALPEFQWFKGVEDKVQQVIYEALGFVDLTEPKIVKLADRILLVTEKRDLMPNDWDWESVYNLSPLPDKIMPLLPTEAEQLYLQRHKELKEKLQKAQDDSWDEYH